MTVHSALGGQVYIDTAAGDGVSLDSCLHSVKDFSLTQLPGDYRRVLHKPADLKWALLHYSDPNQTLSLTQAEELDGAAALEFDVLEGEPERLLCAQFLGPMSNAACKDF